LKRADEGEKRAEEGAKPCAPTDLEDLGRIKRGRYQVSKSWKGISGVGNKDRGNI